jgi:hypothetical protein
VDAAYLLRRAQLAEQRGPSWIRAAALVSAVAMPGRSDPKSHDTLRVGTADPDGAGKEAPPASSVGGADKTQ